MINQEISMKPKQESCRHFSVSEMTNTVVMWERF